MRDLSGALIIFAATACFATEFGLVDAIKEQDRKAARALIEAHANVNQALPDGSTPLAWAAYEGDGEIVEMLLKAGAKPNAANEYGETPLTLACATANATVVEKLLQAGADANASRWYGETALMIAAGTGDPRIVRMLIEHGARVEAVERTPPRRQRRDSPRGSSPLSRATLRTLRRPPPACLPAGRTSTMRFPEA
jgi:ankyrin repeat protein